MKQQKLFVFLVIIVMMTVSMMSCKDKLTEVVIDSYEDGFPKQTLYYSIRNNDSVLIQSIEYHNNHKIFIKGNYKNGQRDGFWQCWYDNGNLWSSCYFQEGVQVKESRVYHENGNLYYSGSYDSSGKPIGTWKYYDDNNNLIQEITR